MNPIKILEGHGRVNIFTYSLMKHVVVFILLALFPLIGNGQISGETDVCVGETELYSISIPGAVSHLWTTVDGQISGADNLSSVLITWQNPSNTATVNVAVTNTSNVTTNYSLSVTVHDNPNPVIVSDFESGCIDNPGKDEQPHGDQHEQPDIDDECFKACENSIIEYYIAFPDATSNYSWNVFGGIATPLNANASIIEIQWTGSVGSTGLIQVTETTGNDCVGTSERCVDIIENPKALFDVNPVAAHYCLDQLIYFTNNSVGDNLHYLWDFDDGSTSVDENPVHQYSGAGTYEVWLKAFNECGCVDSISQVVKVIEEPAPKIECISTVCEGDISYYALTNVCLGYTSLTWTVSGGTLLSGQGTLTPEIQWWPGTSLGIIEVTVTGCACSTTARAEVPVITDNLNISGPSLVCTGEEAEFSIPCQPGRYMQWYASGGSIVSRNPLDHEVLIEFPNPGNYTVSVVLSDNAVLKCGKDNLVINFPVTVVPEATITPATDEICEGDSETFTFSYPGGNCTSGNPGNWQVFNGVGSPVTGITNTCNYSLPTTLAPGNYELKVVVDATHAVCNDEISHYFEVVPKPNPPVFGTGDLIVCPNEAFEYTAIPDMGNIIEWTIIGGNSGGATVRTGNEVSVIWTSLPGTLEIRQIAASGLACPSDPIYVTVNEIDPAAYNISGINSTCAINQVPFSFSNGVPATSFDWRLSPEELGSVVNGQFTNTVDVVFQAPASLVFPTTVNLILDAVVCGNLVTYTHPITLEALDVTLNVPPGPICEGDILNLTATTNLTGYSTTYTWYLDGASQGTTSLPSTSINTTGYNGTVSISVEAVITDPGSACNGSSSIDAGSIVILSAPDVSIPDIVNLCPPDPIIVAATQQSIPGGTSGFYNYNWEDPFGNNVPASPNPAAITLFPGVSPLGNYSVTVTDPVNGCSVIENILVTNNCGPPPPLCPPSNTFSFNVVCRTATFTSSITTGTIVEWNFGDGATSTAANPTHTYTRPGLYSVSLEILLPGGSTCFIFETVAIIMREDFEYHFGCGPAGTRTVQFYDRTEYLNGLTGSLTYNWNVSGVGPMSGSTPSINLTPGSYTVDLTINYVGAPYSTSCSISKTVIVPDIVQATLPFYPPICEGNSMSFATAGTGPIVSAIWDFGDGSVSFDLNPDKTYDDVTTNTNYTVTYTVMDDYGCTDVGSTTITVLNNTLEGNVTIVPAVTTAACDQLTLTANGPGTILSYDWTDVYDPGTSIGMAQNQVITNSGVYGVELVDAQGCRAYQESAPMIIYPSPDPLYTGELEYCLGETIELSAMLGSDYDYLWNLSGIPAQSGPDFVYTPFLPGTYSIDFTITDNNVMNPPGSCSTTVTIQVVVHSNPVVNIAETFICAPDVATVASPNPNYLYSWSNGDTGPTANVYYETAIQVTAVDPNGCEATDLVEVSEGPDFCNTMIGCYNFCEGDHTSILNWLAPQGPTFPPPPYYTYQWLMMDSNGDFNPISGATGSTFPFGGGTNGSGFYQVEVTDQFGCIDTSGVIDIDISEKCDCNVEVKEVILECTGEFDQFGNPIYDITITLVNYGIGLSGWNYTTNGGTIVNLTPTSIPGGSISSPTTTVVTGQYIHDGNTNPLCASFIGYDLQSAKECKFEFCVEVPPCDSKPCEFDIKPLEPECIGVLNGVYYYNMDWLFYNYGNAMDVLFIKTDNTTDHISITSGSHIPANSVTPMSFLISTTKPGKICFDIYLQDASGEICYYHFCYEFDKEDCKEIEPCEFDYEAEAECIYRHDIGSYHYDFNIDIWISNAADWDVSIVPLTGPYNVLNYTTTVTGVNMLNISGDYVSYDGQAEPCFTIIFTNKKTGKLCVFEKVCVKITKKCDESAFRDVEDAVDHDITVYPNPSVGMIQILGLDSFNTDNIQVELLSYSGSSVYRRSITNDDLSLVNMDLSSLPDGLYLIKVYTDDALISKRIILNKP